jgi:hypothetical protein
MRAFLTDFQTLQKKRNKNFLQFMNTRELKVEKSPTKFSLPQIHENFIERKENFNPFPSFTLVSQKKLLLCDSTTNEHFVI